MTIGTDLDLDTSDLLYQTRLRELTSVSSRLSDLCTPFAEDIDLKSSMSPIRGDVKKKLFPFLFERRRMLWLASSPISVQERLWARRVIRTDQAVCGLYSTVVCTRRFHDAMVIRRLRFWKLRKQMRWLYWANHGPI
jgi:hypothetical protein